MSLDLVQIVSEIQENLAQYTFTQEQEGYLDISLINRVNESTLQEAKHKLPPSDPLVNTLALILATMQGGPFDFTRLSINEFLKSYLCQINEENQEACTQKYLNCVYEIYLTMLKGYPFQELLWEYLSQCFNTISKYLIEQRLAEGCQVFLNKVATMGKSAAGQGLHTSSIQHFLHNLEVRAREEDFVELADSARNHRFNLETF